MNSISPPTRLYDDRRDCDGFAVLFTGLPAAGKSTLAARLCDALACPDVKLFDGDLLRQNEGTRKGYSRQDRDANGLYAANLASAVVQSNGIAILALITPYASTRERMRERIERVGTFLEVYVATPLQECERRDPKGHYAKARHGRLRHFTGISDPYEPPENPDLIIDTSTRSLNASLEDVFALLARNNLRVLYASKDASDGKHAPK